MKKQKFLSWHSVNEGSLCSRWPGQVRLGRGLQPPSHPTPHVGAGLPNVSWGTHNHGAPCSPCKRVLPAHVRAHTAHPHAHGPCVHTCVCSPHERVLRSQGHALHTHVPIGAPCLHICSLVPGADDLEGLFRPEGLCDPVTCTLCAKQMLLLWVQMHSPACTPAQGSSTCPCIARGHSQRSGITCSPAGTSTVGAAAPSSAGSCFVPALL